MLKQEGDNKDKFIWVFSPNVSSDEFKKDPYNLCRYTQFNTKQTALIEEMFQKLLKFDTSFE